MGVQGTSTYIDDMFGSMDRGVDGQPPMESPTANAFSTLRETHVKDSIDAFEFEPLIRGVVAQMNRCR